MTVEFDAIAIQKACAVIDYSLDVVEKFATEAEACGLTRLNMGASGMIMEGFGESARCARGLTKAIWQISHGKTREDVEIAYDPASGEVKVILDKADY